MELKKALGVLTCIVAFVSLTSASYPHKLNGSEPTAQQIDARVQRKYRSLKTLAYNVHGRIVIRGQGGEIAAGIISGSVRAARPNRFVVETTVEHLGKEFHSTLVTDGNRLWEYDSDNKKYFEKDWASIAKKPQQLAAWLTERTSGDASLPILIAFWSSLSNGKDEVPRIRTVRLGGARPAYEYSMSGVKFGSTKGSFTLAFDASDLLMRRAVISVPVAANAAKGTMSVEFEYSDIVVDEQAPDDLFKFRPPDDARISTGFPPIGKRATAVDSSEIKEREKKEPDPSEEKKPQA